jgi:predicted CopG family antitoxin
MCPHVEISDDLYEQLAERRREDETMADVLERSITENALKTVSGYHTEMTDEEARRWLQSVDDGRIEDARASLKKGIGLEISDDL